MDKLQENFPELIGRILQRINRYPGGNKHFFLRIGKSRSCISNWKAGKWTPSEDERFRVIAVANEVIKLCEKERAERVVRQAELVAELDDLMAGCEI